MVYATSWIIFAVFLVALAHFIYEGILAPSIRMKLRYDLYEVRDELRAAWTDNESGLTEDAYMLLQHEINSAIVHLGDLGLSVLIEASRALKKTEIAERVDRCKKIRNSCHSERYISLRSRYKHAVAMAWMVNSVGLFAWIVPAAFLAATWKWCRRLAARVFLLPDDAIGSFRRSSHSDQHEVFRSGGYKELCEV